MFNRVENELDVKVNALTHKKQGVYGCLSFFISSKEEKSDCHGVKSQKIMSQKLHVPILETIRKNLHLQKKKQLYGIYSLWAGIFTIGIFKIIYQMYYKGGVTW